MIGANLAFGEVGPMWACDATIMPTLLRLVIASGLDVRVLQTRPPHPSAMTTLNTYGHMWPDPDESSRAAVEVVLAARKDSRVKGCADQLRTRRGRGPYACRSAACRRQRS
jgi:hypothetical protein